MQHLPGEGEAHDFQEDDIGGCKIQGERGHVTP